MSIVSCQCYDFYRYCLATLSVTRKEECEKLRDEIKAVLEELERTKLGDDRRLVLFNELDHLYARLATVSPLVGDN